MTTLPAPLVLEEFTPDHPHFDSWATLPSIAFKDTTPVTQEVLDLRRHRDPDHRRLGVLDGTDVVATFVSWDTDLSVPDGGSSHRSVRASAISAVTVAPTHRRRGLLTATMTHELRRAHAAGTPAAVLIASEATIYPHFGFSPASFSSTWVIDRSRSAVRTDLPRSGTTRLIDEAALRELAPGVLNLARRPGTINQREWIWDYHFGLKAWPGKPRERHQGVVHRSESGLPDGYLLYRVEESWRERICRNTAHVVDLCAASVEAEVALWEYLLTADLIATVRAEDRAVDEILPHLLVDPRAASRVATADFMWARLLDPAAALSARAYESTDDLSFEVVDDLGLATGDYRLAVDADGSGRCTRRSVGDQQSPSDLRLDQATLAGLWLGSSVHASALSLGRVVERTPGAWSRLVRLMRTTREPWSPIWF